MLIIEMLKSINVLEFSESKMVQNVVNLMFRHGLIPTVKKPIRVTRNTATAIDRIITNSVILSYPTDISDLFPILFIFKCDACNTRTREEFIYKQNYSSNSIETFKEKLRQVNCNEVKQSNNANESYSKFPEIYIFCMKNVFLSPKLSRIQRKILILG